MKGKRILRNLIYFRIKPNPRKSDTMAYNIITESRIKKNENKQIPNAIGKPKDSRVKEPKRQVEFSMFRISIPTEKGKANLESEKKMKTQKEPPKQAIPSCRPSKQFLSLPPKEISSSSEEECEKRKAPEISHASYLSKKGPDEKKQDKKFGIGCCVKCIFIVYTLLDSRIDSKGRCKKLFCALTDLNSMIFDFRKSDNRTRKRYKWSGIKIHR